MPQPIAQIYRDEPMFDFLDEQLSDFDRRDTVRRNHRKPFKGRSERTGLIQRLATSLRAQTFTSRFTVKQPQDIRTGAKINVPEPVIETQSLAEAQQIFETQALAEQQPIVDVPALPPGVTRVVIAEGVTRVENAEDLRLPELDDGAIILPERESDLQGFDIDSEEKSEQSRRSDRNRNAGHKGGKSEKLAAANAEEPSVPAYISGRSQKYINRTKTAAAQQKRRR